MNAQDLRDLIEKSTDKYSVFADMGTLSKYEFTTNQFLTLIKEFITDEEKARLFELSHFERLSSDVKRQIIGLIQDRNAIQGIINNDKVVSTLETYDLISLIKSLDNNVKLDLLHNSEFFEKHNIKSYEIVQIIHTLSDETRQQLLVETDLLGDKLQLKDYEISEIIKGLEKEEDKLKMAKFYDLAPYQMADILKSFSETAKIQALLENQYEFNRNELSGIIATLPINSIIDFFKDNKDFLKENNIKPYSVIQSLSSKEKVEFISELENSGLSNAEKRQILATLDSETKKSIDSSNLPPDLKEAFDMQISEAFEKPKIYGRIVVDFQGDLNRYRDLDDILYINPLEVEEKDKSKLLTLLEICPNAQIKDDIIMTSSTIEEYKSGEQWIQTVLSQIEPNWSAIQKIAFIDNAIGKKISYSPDFDTEVFNPTDARALWKIIDSGNGVCNGISQIEHYMFNKVGIESEIVSSNTHAFLKLKNIEVQNQDGSITIGDTILDPTWNLSSHRYGAKPQEFCVSYEEIRKHDLLEDGTDRQSHKNDEALASATLNLDDKTIRQAFTSIGLADKDGKFPIKEFIEDVKLLSELSFPPEKQIEKLLLLLSDTYPDFANSYNSTANLLQGVVLNQENLQMDGCIANRVYEKSDKTKTPVLYVCADLGEAGKQFYFADKNEQQFLQLSQEEFESRFECYELDLQRQGGTRPWETMTQENKKDNLTYESSHIVAEEGER